jgi:hypothetical protein
MACQFKVRESSGFGLSYLNESSSHPGIIGDTQSGMSVAYGFCQNSAVLVVTINYFASGTSSACSNLRIVPDPNSTTGTIEVVDCSFSRSEGIGGKLVVNPDGTCDCGPASEFTSWGRIKAQYD